MIALPGSALLHDVPTSGLERAEADTDCERLLSINAELIIEQWDPFLVETQNIPVLAFGLATTLWEDSYWAEGTKRQWLADQWTWKAKVGTQRAIEMALAPSGYNIVQALLPPQGLFISPDMTKAEWDKWVHLMPELRITYAVREGSAGNYLFIDDGYCDYDALEIDLGPAYYGRDAFVRYSDGRIVGTIAVDLTTVTFEQPVRETNRIFVPGDAGRAFVIDDSAIDDDYGIIEGETLEAYILTISLDRTYNSGTSQLMLTPVLPGLEPMAVNYERDSDIGDGSIYLFLDIDCLDGPDVYIADESYAARLLADRVFLFDPFVAAPMLEGVSFIDEARLGLEPKTAELLIDLHTTESSGLYTFIDNDAIDVGFLSDNEQDHQTRAYRAVAASQALRDNVLVRFDTKMPLPVSSPIINTKIGDYVTTML